MYASKDDVKLKMGITTALTADEASRVDFYLAATGGVINDILGIDSLIKGTKTQMINPCCDIGRDYTIDLSNIEVISVNKIDDTAYTGVLNTDYYILNPHNRKVLITNLSDFISSTKKIGLIKMEYTAGYTIARNVTFTNSTNKVNLSNHGLSVLDPITFFNYGGGLPLEMSVGTQYFVEAITTNDFTISLTSGGSALNFSTDGTGTNTVLEQDSIPKDLIFLQCALVEGELNKEGGQEVKSEMLGPRMVTFKDQNTFSLAASIVQKYKLLNWKC